jgi:hypothetical protein
LFMNIQTEVDVKKYIFKIYINSILYYEIMPYAEKVN